MASTTQLATDNGPIYQYDLDKAKALIAEAGVPVFAIKGQSLEEHWDYLDKSFAFPEGANLILDDGGDATSFALWGARLEAGETMPEPGNPEEIEMQRAVKAFVAANPGYLTKTVKNLTGVSEETPTGVHRL